MIAIVATLYVKPEHAKTFEDAFAGLARQVREKEPGNHFYQLAKGREEEGVYKVLELYADQAALDAHGQTDHFKNTFRGLRDVFAGPPKIERLDAVG